MVKKLFSDFADSSVLSGYDTRVPGILLNDSLKDPKSEERRSYQSMEFIS